MLRTFERVLAGEVAEVPHFSITAQKSFELRHSIEASKRLRFVCLKGAIQGEGRDSVIRWWQDPTEFVAYAKALKPIGWDEICRPAETVCVEERPCKRQRLSKRSTNDGVLSVYILHGTQSASTYVGCSNDVEHRLRQHNRVICDGAAATAGEVWSIVGQCTGFTSRKQALRFEGRLAHSATPLVQAEQLSREPDFIGVTVTVVAAGADSVRG